MSFPTVSKRALGKQGLVTSAQGLGCMGMSWLYSGNADEQECIQVIHRALELGVTLLDTSDVYGPFTNEELVGRYHYWLMVCVLRLLLRFQGWPAR